MRDFRFLLHWAVLIVLAGCAAPGKLVPPVQARAIELNQKGLDKFQRKDFVAAEALFRQALNLEKAVENEDGIALNTLNLSQTLRMQGEEAESEKEVDCLLDERRLAYPESRLAEAALQKSLYAMQKKDLGAAGKWQEQAANYCKNTCALSGKILNVAVRLYLEQGDTAHAMETGRRALDKNRENRDELEIANSLRLLAYANILQGAFAPAMPLLIEALSVDKALAASDKIFEDLVLLGNASPAASRERNDYWMRAQVIAKAAGNLAQQKQINELLAVSADSAGEMPAAR